MRILDRYIFQRLLRTLCYWVVGIGILYIVHDQVENRGDYMDWSWGKLGRYYGYKLPEILYSTLPLLTFFSVAQVVHGLAQHQEMIAMLAIGTHLRRLIFPYALYVGVVTSVNYGIAGWLLPWGKKAGSALAQHEAQATDSAVIHKEYFQVGPGQFVHMGHYDLVTHQGHEFVLETFQDNRRVARMEATHFRWDTDIKQWVLYGKWKKQTTDGDTQIVEQGTSPLPWTEGQLVPTELKAMYAKPETLHWGSLNRHIKLLRRQGASNLYQFEITRWPMLLRPITVLIFTLLAWVLWGRDRRYRLYATLLGVPSYAFWLSIAKTAAMASPTPIRTLLLPHCLGLGMVVVFYWWL